MKNSNRKLFLYEHKPIRFEFRQSVDRFFVEEIPLYQPSNRGDWLFIRVRKRDMSTLKLISVLKTATGASDREIGYAGLKDKNADTIQTISIPKRYEKELKNLTTDRIEILSTALNRKPLKRGELKGNRFKIILKRVDNSSYREFVSSLKEIARGGFPNYFGYQRFGEDGKSWEQGKKIAHSGKRLKGAKEKLLVASWQSKLFNDWLAYRIEISKIVNSLSIKDASKRLKWDLELIRELKSQPHIFKIFQGELMSSLSQKRTRVATDTQKYSRLFAQKELTPTGILCGDRVESAKSDAGYLEEQFIDNELNTLPGSRRLAWVWAEDIEYSYDSNKQELTLHFTLPKGSYATTLLEEIGNVSLKQ